MDREKIPVKLKGVGNSLCLILDPENSTDFLEEEIARLLGDLKQKVSGARVSIDVGSQDEHSELIEHLTVYLKDNYGVSSVERNSAKKMPRKKTTGAEKWDRKQDMDHSWHQHPTEGLMLAGRVRSGQKVTTRKHLVIMGDVNPGAEVIAGGDILIIGSLLGTAIAGQPDDENSIVLALDFRPMQIQIGGYVAAGHPSSPGKVAEFAHVEEGKIVVENYLEANPFGRMPWPKAR
jgi:septum site-determining protein MinC